MKKYFLQMEGMYPQGVFWIGDDLEEGFKVQERMVEEDCDSYHKWVLYEFTESYKSSVLGDCFDRSSPDTLHKPIRSLSKEN